MPSSMPTDRIRMLQELMRSRQGPAMLAPDAPPVSQLEVDFPEMDRPMPQMDMPTEAQINADIAGPPQIDRSASPAERQAAALQYRRSNPAAVGTMTRPYGS